MGNFACCISLPPTRAKLHFRALDEAIDADSEAYCWRRNGFLWRMRASLGLVCAQATILSSQVFGNATILSSLSRVVFLSPLVLYV